MLSHFPALGDQLFCQGRTTRNTLAALLTLTSFETPMCCNLRQLSWPHIPRRTWTSDIAAAPSA
jgi:hypothetical protein